MNLTDIFSGAIGAGVLAIVLKLIDAYSNRNKTRADAAKTIVEGGAEAVSMMRSLLADYDKVNDDQAAKIEILEKGREERTRLIAELQKQTENDTTETKLLRDEVQLLRRQVAEGESKYRQLEEKYNKNKQALELIIAANPNLSIPEDAKMLLGDSIAKIKAIR